MPVAKPNRRSVQLRIDEVAHAKVKIIARKEERNLNSQLEYYIKKGIEQFEIEHGPVQVTPEDLYA